MNSIEMLQMYEEQGYLQKETIHGAVSNIAGKFPEKTAVIDCDGSYTYKELDEYSDRLASFFLQNGLKREDTVLLQLPNCRLYVAVLMALLKAGIVPVLMLPTHRGQELSSVSEVIKPKAYIGCDEFLGFEYVKMVQVSEETVELPIEKVFSDKEFGGEKRFPVTVIPEYEESIGIAKFKDYEDDYRKIALFLLSGGTTNMPKLIPRIHEAYVYNAKAVSKVTDITEKTVYMAVLSTSHDYPLADPGILGCLYNGGTVVMCQTAGFDEAFEMIEEHRVTITSIVPAIAQIWTEVLDWYEGDFSSLERITIGAAKLEREIALKLIDKMGITLHQAYGLGEGITCYTSASDDLEVILTTQGKPVSAGDEVKIVDADGNELPRYGQGELIEKGPYTFFGYYGDDRLNENLFTEDGFLHTGDKAYMDDGGNIVICGRVKEQINRAGENVTPSEVESILKKHPDIKDAAVFGREDKNLGERTCAVLVSDNKEISITDITSFFNRQGVAQYKIPDEIHLRDELVFTNVGKVDKKRLKKMLEESEPVNG
jgi:yersiniabactin salicyl-AMP ligase